MNVIVRLYWQHDLDLVALTLHPMFEMGKWMKKAMIAYAQGDEEFHIPLPPEMPPEKPLENSDAHFALDPKNEIENEVIKILQQFRNGQRNSVIKLIFRNYLDELFLKPYIDTNTYIVKARGNYGGKKKEYAYGITINTAMMKNNSILESRNPLAIIARPQKINSLELTRCVRFQFSSLDSVHGIRMPAL